MNLDDLLCDLGIREREYITMEEYKEKAKDKAIKDKLRGDKK